MIIHVDADACPVKDIVVRIAKRKNIPVVMYADYNHVIEDAYSKTITVDQGADSADLTIINSLSSGDVVVTQDYGLAALALGKGAKAIHQNGLIYTDYNIDKLLFERHLSQKIRKSGGRTKNHKKRTSENNTSFETSFISLLNSIC